MLVAFLLRIASVASVSGSVQLAYAAMQTFEAATWRCFSGTGCPAIRCEREPGCGGNWAQGNRAAHSAAVGAQQDASLEQMSVLDGVMDGVHGDQACLSCVQASSACPGLLVLMLTFPLEEVTCLVDVLQVYSRCLSVMTVHLAF